MGCSSGRVLNSNARVPRLGTSEYRNDSSILTVRIDKDWLSSRKSLASMLWSRIGTFLNVTSVS